MSDHAVDPSVLADLHRAIPGGLSRTSQPWSRGTCGERTGSALYGSAFYATVALPGTEIEKGSLIVHAYST